MSVFEQFRAQAYPYKFAGELLVGRIAGGIPTDPKVAEGWLKTKLGAGTKDDQIQAMVAEVMVARGITADQAIEEVNANKHLNGFKRDENGVLYIEGRQLKAAIKEAVSVAVAVEKLPQRGWGKTNKGLLSFTAEHIFVVEDRLSLGVKEATGVAQRFVHTRFGSGIQNEEFVDDAKIAFTIMSDFDFSEKDWASLWLVGEQQGIGASRSQGYGRYEVTRWDALTATGKKKAVKK